MENPEAEQLNRNVSNLASHLRAISDRCSAFPDLDLRTPEKILGFDEHGLPA